VQDRISTIRLSGLGDDADVSEARISLSAMATSVSVVHGLADNIRRAFHRYHGIIASVTIGDCWLENESSLYFSDIEVYQQSLDYMFRFTETTS
jgi:Ni,Fe-hydrogenase III large subunit